MKTNEVVRPNECVGTEVKFEVGDFINNGCW